MPDMSSRKQKPTAISCVSCLKYADPTLASEVSQSAKKEFTESLSVSVAELRDQKTSGGMWYLTNVVFKIKKTQKGTKPETYHFDVPFPMVWENTLADNTAGTGYLSIRQEKKHRFSAVVNDTTGTLTKWKNHTWVPASAEELYSGFHSNLLLEVMTVILVTGRDWYL